MHSLCCMTPMAELLNQFGHEDAVLGLLQSSGPDCHCCSDTHSSHQLDDGHLMDGVKSLTKAGAKQVKRVCLLTPSSLFTSNLACRVFPTLCHPNDALFPWSAFVH